MRKRHDNNYRLGIATGCFAESARVKLGAIGIPTDGLVVSCADERQDRVQIVRHVIEHEQALIAPQAFESITYVGDGVWDYKTARILGIGFIGIDVRGNGKLRALGAEHVVRDYTLLLQSGF